MSAGSLPTAPASPEGGAEPVDAGAQSLAHERLKPSSNLPAAAAYPSPPVSSASSSIYRLRPDSPENGQVGTAAKKPSHARVASYTHLASVGLLPLPSTRRHTITHANPLSTVTATAHISNPATRLPSQTTPSTPIIAALSASRRPSVEPSQSQAQTQSKELTEPSTGDQSTPPQTPRTRSHEGKATPSSRSASRGAPQTTVGPVLGKLTVWITEGRGLRASLDPYAVCQFQQAEYISDGPKNTEGLEAESAAGGVSMARSGSDMGRPRAIPMKSRQSSHTGLPDLKLARTMSRQVTDPEWDHEAIL